MTRSPTKAMTPAPEAESSAVHWVSARAAARLLVIEVGTFQRIARINGVRTWHPRGMRHPRYHLGDVRALVASPARPRASPAAGA
jgi:hypothetical protein